MSSATRHIALVAYPGFTALDLLGPHHVLSMLPGVKVHIVAASREAVTSDMGVTLLPTTSFEESPADLTAVMVPGGTAGTLAAMQDPALQAFLRDRGARAQWVCSVCTGSLVLGAAGLLQGYRATSHWATLDLLARMGAEPVAERYVRDRNRFTGAGVTAGLDFGLALVAELSDPTFARKVQLLAEYDPAPPFDAGSPAKAGEAITADIRGHLTKFLEAADRVVQAVSAAGNQS